MITPSFTNLQKLRTSVHTSEKLFEYSICRKTFTQEKGLKVQTGIYEKL